MGSAVACRASRLLPLKAVLRHAERPLINGIDVDRRAIDQRETRILTLERQKQIGAAEHDGIGALLAHHLAAGAQKYLASSFGDCDLRRPFPEAYLVHCLQCLASRRHACSAEVIPP